ncbi:1-acyl-sn-glycerol-3-phosphate acyltransferase [Croceitalea dokdonensis DOKDO 023]|uniref:1-acyl-sn-glycerol-3-phosphate acyltransferase n=1 Tax=Croceitalea dokdonensis DOKDO 023 TaxID=1300341 RepID=A0A0N8H3M8_9FLAO|nr:lysophospholipid acyltransferase family protein [Croceitalea dokdonensis]KPM31012.1 1-acyl-sn-glycerol-3-phosphate acyltransferase [Croceitalea dokdonensis DOKDO 023]
MIKLLKNIGHVLYRVWFYLLVALPIFVFFPILLLTTISERTYPQFFWIARNLWAKTILYGMGCFPKITWQQKLERDKSYMLVANHTSMLDIMLMLYTSKNPFVFVGKMELAKIPVFGFFYKRVCILVDRNNPKSRTAVYRRVQHRLQQKLSICIFPEGGVPDEEVLLDRFKDGAFRMAIRHHIPVVPMSFLDCKKRFSWTFLSGGPGPLRVKVHSFFETGILGAEDTSTLREEVRQVILSELDAST